MTERKYVVLGILTVLAGVFGFTYFANGAGVRAITPAILTALVSLAGMMMMYFYGKAIGEAAGTPPQAYPTAEHIAAVVAEALTNAERAYDPESVGQRLTSIQATLADIAMAVHRLESRQ